MDHELYMHLIGIQQRLDTMIELLSEAGEELEAEEQHDANREPIKRTTIREKPL